MKSISVFVIGVLIATSSFGQSNSYQALTDKFKGEPDVYSFSLRGWMGRMVLGMAGEHEFRNAIKDLHHLRIITIPQQAFSTHHVSVTGFKKIVLRDSFEEIAFIHEHHEDVSIYLREGDNNKNLYLVLVEEEDEVVVIEMKGYINPKLLNNKNATLAINK